MSYELAWPGWEELLSLALVVFSSAVISEKKAYNLKCLSQKKATIAHIFCEISKINEDQGFMTIINGSAVALIAKTTSPLSCTKSIIFWLFLYKICADKDNARCSALSMELESIELSANYFEWNGSNKHFIIQLFFSTFLLQF